MERFGGIDVLVNNAATSGAATSSTSPVELWDTIMAVNLRAPFILLQEAIKPMRARGGGSIVNIGSVLAYVGEPKLGAYSVSKGGLMTLTRNAAAPLNRDRIRVNQINVGWTLTEGERRVKREQEGKGEEWIARGDRDAAVRPAARSARHRLRGRLLRLGESECVTGSVLDLEQYPPGALTELRDSDPRISVFPKCYFDELVPRRDGLRGVDPRRAARSAAKASSTTTASSAASATPTSIRDRAAMDETGQVTSMICFSPDFTHPDPDERRAPGRAAEGGDRSRPSGSARGSAARSAASALPG